MAVPDVHELGQVVDVGEIDLRLDRVLERAAARLQPRLETRRDQEFSLQPDVGAVPHRVGRTIGLRIKAGHGLVVRHLPGDEDIIAAHERSDKAGMLRDRNAVGPRGMWLAALARKHRQQRNVHVGADGEQFLHQHRRARRHVILQQRLARALIGINAFGARIILVDAHDVTEIAAFRRDQLGKAIEDEMSLAQIARCAAERLARVSRATEPRCRVRNRWPRVR